MPMAAFIGLDDTPSYTENGGLTVLDSDATLDGAATYNGAMLTLARQGGANPNDVFDGIGTLSLSDGQVLLQETEPESSEPLDIIVGTYANSDGTLVITFNADATEARVNAVLEQLAYGYGGEAPPPTAGIDYAFNDGQSPVALGSITVTLVGENDPPSLDSVAPAAAYVPARRARCYPRASSSTISIRRRSSAPWCGSSTGPTPLHPRNHHGHAGRRRRALGQSRRHRHRRVLRHDDAHPDALRHRHPRPVSAGPRHGRLQLAGCRSEPGRRKHDPQHRVADRRRRPQRQPERGPDYRPPLYPVARSRRRRCRRRLRDRLHRERPGRADRRHGFGLTNSGGADLSFATITLTNAKPGDSLAIAGALPAGITGTVDTTSVPGQIIVGLGGAASPANYQAALRQVVFGSSSENPDTSLRDITVVVGDETETSNTAHTTIAVTAVNDAPVAQDGSASGDEDTTIFGNAVATDVDNTAAQLTYSLVGVNGGAQHGTVSLNPDGSFAYTPAADFSGADSFAFK